MSSDTSPNPSSKSHSSSVRLPSFPKHPLPRGTDAPVILKDYPRLHKRRKSGWKSVADDLANRDGVKEGDNEPTYPRLMGPAHFDLRGFGCFDITWGIVAYGQNFAEISRRICTDDTEELRLRHIKCKITNRLATGFHMLKMGSGKLGFEDDKNLILGDCAHVSNADIDEHFLTGVKAETDPAQPRTVECFRR